MRYTPFPLAQCHPEGLPKRQLPFAAVYLLSAWLITEGEMERLCLSVLTKDKPEVKHKASASLVVLNPAVIITHLRPFMGSGGSTM